jgi:hypothetical protein
MLVSELSVLAPLAPDGLVQAVESEEAAVAQLYFTTLKLQDQLLGSGQGVLFVFLQQLQLRSDLLQRGLLKAAVELTKADTTREADKGQQARASAQPSSGVLTRHPTVASFGWETKTCLSCCHGFELGAQMEALLLHSPLTRPRFVGLRRSCVPRLWLHLCRPSSGLGRHRCAPLPCELEKYMPLCTPVAQGQLIQKLAERIAEHRMAHMERMEAYKQQLQLVRLPEQDMLQAFRSAAGSSKAAGYHSFQAACKWGSVC